MVTAYGREEIIHQADINHIDGFLIKPVNQTLLFDTIMMAFGKKKTGAETKKENQKSELESIKNSTVMLVEDNELNTQIAVELLEGENLKVIVMHNGKESVDYFNKNKNHLVDLILMDLQMPEMDGYEATSLIRKIDKNSDLPIIAMTADAMTGVQDKVLMSGMNDYITKPFEVDKLFETLVKWIPPKEQSLTLDNREKKVPINIDLDYDKYSSIDIEDGIKRVSGNILLYVKILVSFKNNYRFVKDDIAALLKQNDRIKAENLAHSLKGVSGNIGAAVLFNNVKMLDDELRLENYNFEKVSIYLNAVEEELIKVIKEIETIEPLVQKNQAETKAAEKASDEALDSLYKTLVKNLEDYEAKSEEAFEIFKKNITEKESEEELSVIDKLIKKYDYENALINLKNLMGSRLK